MPRHVTRAHGGTCQLCAGYTQLLTKYGGLDLCPLCWSDKLEEHEPELYSNLMDLGMNMIKSLPTQRVRT